MMTEKESLRLRVVGTAKAQTWAGKGLVGCNCCRSKESASRSRDRRLTSGSGFIVSTRFFGILPERIVRAAK